MAGNGIRIVTVEISGDGEPIRGSLCGPDGLRREFYGWTSLASELERSLGRGVQEPVGARTEGET